MRQLSQKETDKLYNFVVPEPSSTRPSNQMSSTTNNIRSYVPLELQLFNRLDVETDLQTRRDIEEILLNMLQSSSHSRFSLWLSTLKEVLQVRVCISLSSLSFLFFSFLLRFPVGLMFWNLRRWQRTRTLPSVSFSIVLLFSCCQPFIVGQLLTLPAFGNGNLILFSKRDSSKVVKSANAHFSQFTFEGPYQV